jgi:hypothetical protein
MAWRLVRSLGTLRTQVRAAAPRAVPPATPAVAWGTIGDLAHQSGTSDHNAAVYPVLGTTPVVCAHDFPHAPALGLDGHAFTEALRQSRDRRIAYVIFDGRIFSSTVRPWEWRPYSGSDQHRDHWHVSVVRTAVADDTAPWRMPGALTSAGDDDMTPDQAAALARIDGRVTTLLYNPRVNDWNQKGERNQLREQLDRIEAAAAADEVRDNAALAAIKALTTGEGTPEVAPIIAAIREAAAQTNAYVRQLQDDLAASRADNAELRARLAAAFGPGSE